MIVSQSFGFFHHNWVGVNLKTSSPLFRLSSSPQSLSPRLSSQNSRLLFLLFNLLLASPDGPLSSKIIHFPHVKIFVIITIIMMVMNMTMLISRRTTERLGFESKLNEGKLDSELLSTGFSSSSSSLSISSPLSFSSSSSPPHLHHLCLLHHLRHLCHIHHHLHHCNHCNHHHFHQ